MLKKFKKITFIIVVLAILLFGLPSFVEWRENEDIKMLEKIIDNI